ncbi:alpha/beta hydrolase family protein [Leucobacter komagatae]|uniref:Alpha/beta hydrolase family protein n=1 Tax=Leucobacter komagatae TaxID=55969 RepID=A0A542XXH2_9MICO|nr:alpha/beta hydrolase [Leucobacter komagatae]TQL40528.1 alpha/beta hydrolase family protein [Leucobacter komagatae]
MPIEFDDAVADKLVKVLEAGDDVLRGQSQFRSGAAERASEGFEGNYGVLFKVAVGTEKQDRVKLARVLYDLAQEIKEAKLKAQEERARLEELASWRVREAEREQRRQTDAFGDSFTAGVDSFFDPRPSEVPVAAPSVSASFSAQQRLRTAARGRPGKSSADPVKLRSFVSQGGASNIDLDTELSSVRNAWSAFTGSCGWVRVGSTSFVAGFQQLLNENRLDVDWIDGVAAAFEAAGGGSLSNTALDLSATAVNPLSDEALLEALSTLSAEEIELLFGAFPVLQRRLEFMDPVAIYEWWQGMNPLEGAEGPFSDQQTLLLEGFAVLFGNLEGLPYGARDYANRAALDAALEEVKAEIARLEALGEKTTVLETQLAALENIKLAAKANTKDAPRFLISLTQDQPPLAAVSIGDLDKATSVAYAIPGMGTDTTGMTGWTNAAQNLYSMLPEGSAVVAWIGYETPPMPSLGDPDFGVLDSKRAIAGGNNLAAALRGLAAVRGGSMPQLDIVAHSYGTTTAAVALTQPGVNVKNFITLGSAGLPDSITKASQLNAEKVYSGHARDRLMIDPDSGDQWAWIGRDFSSDHKVDPMHPAFGGRPFGVDTGGDAGDPVVGHDPLIKNGGGYFSQDTESLRNVVRAIKGETADITEYVPLGPTQMQEAQMGLGQHGW